MKRTERNELGPVEADKQANWKPKRERQKSGECAALIDCCSHGKAELHVSAVRFSKIIDFNRITW